MNPAKPQRRAAFFLLFALLVAGCSQASPPGGLPDFADLVDGVSSSVVNISTVPAEELAAAAPISLRPRQEAQWGWLLRRLVHEELLSESNDGAQRLYLQASGRRYRRQPWPLHWAA